MKMADYRAFGRPGVKVSPLTLGMRRSNIHGRRRGSRSRSIRSRAWDSYCARSRGCHNEQVTAMPTLLSDPITETDLVKYLESTSDFQFEMEIFRSCVEHGFNAVHGGTYADPVTGSDRLFDIRATYLNPQYYGLNTFLKLAVECKNLRENYPLLVSCVPRLREESFHCSVLSRVKRSRVHASTGEHEIITYRIVSETLRFGYMDGSIFQPGELVGKSTVQVGKTSDGTKSGSKFSCDDSEVYEGWSQAVSSAYEMILEAYGNDAPAGIESVASVIFPVLVVPDERLWTVEYSPEGVRQGNPKKVERCEFYLGKNFSGLQQVNEYRISHLLIFTKSGFEKYLTDFCKPSSHSNLQWDHLFPDIEIKNAIHKLSVMPPDERGVSQETRPIRR